MTKEQREAIRGRCDEATPGPWNVDTRRCLPNCYICHEGVGWPIASMWRTANGSNFENDAEFIASARQDVPALLDALEEAESERDEAERAFQAELGLRQKTEANRDQWKLLAEQNLKTAELTLAESDRWKARAIRAESDYEKARNHATNLTCRVKALERALEVEKTCMTCEYVDCDTGDEPCCRCDRGQGVHDCWTFNEARFSGGEENKNAEI